ncbi:MAG: DUF2891 domain-containing protein [Planctomycetes bacterium]|nr:DUF2891 domain-containing protein [Planctomycetota bacterium]
MRLEPGLAAALARVAIANVSRPFPHKLDHLLADADSTAADHVVRHPVFCGAYDWHSAVHMHWLLARMLRLFPAGEAAAEIHGTLDRRLGAGGLATERAYFASPAGRTFERPYGWAWLLALRAEVGRLARGDERAVAWAAAVDPLARDLATRLAAFVRSAGYPVRSGTHGNTAFACLLALDYAGECGDRDLATVIRHAALRWHVGDRDAPTAYEPSLTDFLSPVLCAAALMAEALPAESFAAWFDDYLPGGVGRLAEPTVVGDRSDPQVAHLDGLGLSRAWCLRRIASALPAHHPRSAELRAAASGNLEPALPHVIGGDYAGEHWLATFAVLALEA